MKKLLQVTHDLAILPHHVSAVKRGGLDGDDGEDSCIVYMTGQGSTTEGFLISIPYEVVIEEVNLALRQEAIDKARLAAEATAEIEHSSGKPKFKLLKDTKEK